MGQAKRKRETDPQIILLRSWFPEDDGGIPAEILRNKRSVNTYIRSRLEAEYRAKKKARNPPNAQVRHSE